MATFVLALMIVFGVVSVIGGLLLLIGAFRESPGWGFLRSRTGSARVSGSSSTSPAPWAS